MNSMFSIFLLKKCENWKIKQPLDAEMDLMRGTRPFLDVKRAIFYIFTPHTYEGGRVRITLCS